MNITDIRIRKIVNGSMMRAVVSVTIDNDFAVHEIKVIERQNRLFVAMPSRKDVQGTHRDIVHPIAQQARNCLEDAILKEYRKHIQKPEEACVSI